jgi:hypothetical protein
MFGVTAKLVERLGTEIAEIWMLAQHRQLVARKLRGFPGFVLRHANQASRSGADVKQPAPKMSMMIS